MNSIKMIVVFFSSAILTIGLYCFGYYHQIGSSVKAEWWLKEAVTKKEYLLSQINSGERIIFLSGSNSLFGLRSTIIEESFKYPTFNFGLHASLDLSYLSNVANKVAKKGDIFIVPLEYSYYLRKNEYSVWFINNMLAWGSDYISNLSLYKKASFLFHTDASRVFEGIITKSRWVMDSESDVRNFKPTGEFKGYSYKSIHENGDITTPSDSTKYVKSLIDNPEKNEKLLSYTSDMTPEPYSISKIIELKNTIEAKGGRFILTWPVSMKSAYFNKNNAQSIEFAFAIQKSLDKVGIQIHCMPFEFNINQNNFYDTYYHLNSVGEIERTEKVLECLTRERLINSM